MDVLLQILFAIAAGVVACAVPLFFVFMGWRAIKRQRLSQQRLSDDNTVTADPEGPRKLHEYLTAITSTEARIGLLQRSEPYPGDKPQS